MTEIKQILSLIRGYRFPLNDEKILQAEIEAKFVEHGIKHVREYRLSAKDIVDFFVADHIGVEVKIKGSKLNIYRQCERYMMHDEVKSLILITNVPTGMPQLINGKPIFVSNLAKAWL